MTIRTRLALVYAAALAVTLLLVGGVVWWQMGIALRASLETALETRAAGVLTSLENNGQAGLQETDARAPGVFAALFDAGGTLIDASSSAPAGLSPTAGVLALGGQRYLVAVQPASGGMQIVTGASLAATEQTQAELARTLAIIGLLLGLLSVAGVWLLARQALRPVERLASAAAALGPTDLGHRLPVPSRTDEVAQLTSTLNTMLERIEESVSRQRLFVAMASHELRTPLTALRVELELVERPEATQAELRDALRAASADAVRLTNLSDALLELAVSAEDTQRLARRSVPLREVIDAALRSVEPLAADRHARLTTEVTEAAVWIDPRRVEQAIANLLANAVLHGPDVNTVQLRADVVDDPHGQMLQVEVLDRGPGLGGEASAALFAPFRRGRHVERPGAGLGLALVASVVTAHGGRYGAEDRTDGGARFWFDVRCGVDEPDLSGSQGSEPDQRSSRV